MVQEGGLAHFSRRNVPKYHANESLTAEQRTDLKMMVYSNAHQSQLFLMTSPNKIYQSAWQWYHSPAMRLSVLLITDACFLLYNQSKHQITGASKAMRESCLKGIGLKLKA